MTAPDDESLTVYGVTLRLDRGNHAIRVWRGRDADLGTLRVKFIRGVIRGVNWWIVRRVSTYSTRLSVGCDDEKRARAHIEVTGSGPDLAAALRALDEAEALLGEQRLAACLARRAKESA